MDEHQNDSIMVADLISVQCKGTRNLRVVFPEPLHITKPDGTVIQQKAQNFWFKNVAELSEIVRTVGDYLLEGSHVYYGPNPVREGQCSSTRNVLNLSCLILDLDLRKSEISFTADDILRDCAKLGVEPTFIVDSSGGFHVGFVYSKPIYVGPRRGVSNIVRLNRLAKIEAWHKEVYSRMVRLFAHRGADPQCSDVGRVFRLPGFENPRHRHMVEIIHLNPEAKTGLKELSQASREALKKRPFCNPAKSLTAVATSEPPSPCTANAAAWPIGNANAAILETQGFKWLSDSTFLQGDRNGATFAFCSIVMMAGLNLDEARLKLESWTQQHTNPQYPPPEAKAVLRSVYKNHCGVTRDKLLLITNADGQVMARDDADSIIQAMPRKSRHTATRRNEPQVVTVIKILEALHGADVYNKWTPMSAKKLARKSGRSLKQVQHVVPFLDELGIRELRRDGSSFVAHYCLRCLTGSLTDLINRFGRWAKHNRYYQLGGFYFWARLKKLWVKFRAVMVQWKKLCDAVHKRLCELIGGEFWAKVVQEDEKGRGGIGGRAPPAAAKSGAF